MAVIVVGFDGSPPARRALDHAASRATLDDELVLVWVLPASVRERSFAAMMPAGIELPPEMGGTFEERARARLAEVVSETAKRGLKTRGELLLGEPADVILGVVEDLHATLLVIGHKAFEGRTLTLGQNADAILRGSKIPVTVVP